MKKKVVLLSITILCCIFTSCANSTLNSTIKDTSKTVGTPESKSKGFTVNKIAFETLNQSDIPETLKLKIDKIKKQKGYIFEERDGYYYVAISSGEKPTGGYRTKVLSVEDNEGKTNILVEEITPSKDDVVIQVLTYPYTVIKIKGVTSNFNVKSTKGELFNKLN